MAEAQIPTIVPLGDCALLVRFSDSLSDEANREAVGFARRAAAAQLNGVLEVVPNLVSVLLRFDPFKLDGERLAGELRLLISAPQPRQTEKPRRQTVSVVFGGADGPDLAEVAETLGLSTAAFIAAHNARPLRVLATGFAPGFVYCGFHPEGFQLPRRTTIRPRLPAGTVLFAAGQTAITATAIPSGWNVIGRTSFLNFDAGAEPPTRLAAGDMVMFEEVGA
ncbi:MAG TPA: allophanate hydrolase subunit 1 [Arsenicitalea sp.]|jgi:KipI family sensor histidine kinase inhibitor|nr:allophanate hydrolase subunit 1 [Arsenicitalea sp.]